VITSFFKVFILASVVFILLLSLPKKLLIKVNFQKNVIVIFHFMLREMA